MCSSFIRRRNYTRRFLPLSLYPPLNLCKHHQYVNLHAPTQRPAKNHVFLYVGWCLACSFSCWAYCGWLKVMEKTFASAAAPNRLQRSAPCHVDGCQAHFRAGVKYDYLTQFFENDFQHNSPASTIWLHSNQLHSGTIVHNSNERYGIYSGRFGKLDCRAKV